jgi:hypothetical protein
MLPAESINPRIVDRIAVFHSAHRSHNRSVSGYGFRCCFRLRSLLRVAGLVGVDADRADVDIVGSSKGCRAEDRTNPDPAAESNREPVGCRLSLHFHRLRQHQPIQPDRREEE